MGCAAPPPPKHLPPEGQVIRGFHDLRSGHIEGLTAQMHPNRQ